MLIVVAMAEGIARCRSVLFTYHMGVYDVIICLKYARLFIYY